MEYILKHYDTPLLKFTAKADSADPEYTITWINEAQKSFLVKPSASKDNDAIRWVKGKETLKIARIECTAFAKQIFKMWDLNENYRYRAVGRLVQAEKKIMLLFDFEECVL